MKQLKNIAIVGCSNPLKKDFRSSLDDMIQMLTDAGLSVTLSRHLFVSGDSPCSSAEPKADELNQFISDPDIDGIFDISGGDAANTILPHIDFESWRSTETPYFGISDNSVILNAALHKAGTTSYHFFLRNILNENQFGYFKDTICNIKREVPEISWNFLSGSSMKGQVFGGNIRCFLKLAGTEYMPEGRNRLLFLESLGGDYYRILSYMMQIKHMGIFNRISGLLLGTFSQLDDSDGDAGIHKIIGYLDLPEDLPVARTSEVGHGGTAKALAFGMQYSVGTA